MPPPLSPKPSPPPPAASPAPPPMPPPSPPPPMPKCNTDSFADITALNHCTCEKGFAFAIGLATENIGKCCLTQDASGAFTPLPSPSTCAVTSECCLEKSSPSPSLPPPPSASPSPPPMPPPTPPPPSCDEELFKQPNAPNRCTCST